MSMVIYTVRFWNDDTHVVPDSDEVAVDLSELAIKYGCEFDVEEERDTDRGQTSTGSST